MNTNLGYSKKTLTNTNVLLSAGGDKPLSDFIGTLYWDSTNNQIKYKKVGDTNYTTLLTFTGASPSIPLLIPHIEGVLNVTSTSAIESAQAGLTSDKLYAIYLVGDGEGKYPSPCPAVTIPSAALKRLKCTFINNATLNALVPDSLFEPIGVNVGDLVIIGRMSVPTATLQRKYSWFPSGSGNVEMYTYRILACEDVKATNFVSGDYSVAPGVMGLASPWDKTLINKIPGIETDLATKLPIITAETNAGNGDQIWRAGYYTNITLGRPTGVTNTMVMLSNGGWGDNTQIAIDKGTGALYSRIVTNSWGRVLRDTDNLGSSDYGYTVWQNARNEWGWAHPLSLRNSNTTDGTTTIISIGGPNDYLGTAYFGFVYKGESVPLNFATIGIYNQDYIINATAAGNVGIGTTTPSSKLEVDGDTTINGHLYLGRQAYFRTNINVGSNANPSSAVIYGTLHAKDAYINNRLEASHLVLNGDATIGMSLKAAGELYAKNVIPKKGLKLYTSKYNNDLGEDDTDAGYIKFYYTNSATDSDKFKIKPYTNNGTPELRITDEEEAPSEQGQRIIHSIIDFNRNLVRSRVNIQATAFVKKNGTSSEFLKADGSVDSNTYLTRTLVTTGTANKLAYYSTKTKITYLNSTIGNSTKPIYINAGIPTAVTSIDASLLSGGIVTSGVTNNFVGLNPAFNYNAYAIEQGGEVYFYLDDVQLIPTNTSFGKQLLDGKGNTAFTPFNMAFQTTYGTYNSSTSYTVGKLCSYTPSGATKVNWYRCKSACKNIVPTNTTYWEDVSASGTYIGINPSKFTSFKIVLKNLPFSVGNENGITLYWRTNTQHPSEVTVKKINSSNTYTTVVENLAITGSTTNIYLGSATTSGNQNGLELTFSGFTDWTNYWGLALQEIAFTGMQGSLEGSVLFRGGGTMFGNITPYSNNGASLGSSTNKWNYLYASYINASSGNFSSVAATSFSGSYAQFGGNAYLSTSHIGFIDGMKFYCLDTSDSATLEDYPNIPTSDDYVAYIDSQTDPIYIGVNIEMLDLFSGSYKNITANKFIKSGGTSSLYLMADGSVKNEIYLTLTRFNSGNPDLAAIEVLTGTSGYLKKTAANTWVLDNSTYLSTTNITNYLKEALLQWGGKNFSGDFGPVDAALCSNLSANRWAFVRPEQVTIKYSTNGGSTWLDYGATDEVKVNLFSGNDVSLITGKNATLGTTGNINNMLQITIQTGLSYIHGHAGTDITNNLYSNIKKLLLYVSTQGASGCYCTIEGITEYDIEQGNTNHWISFATQQSISGWSGYNVINTDFTTYGNSNSKSTQYGIIRFTFGYTSISSGMGLLVLGIQAFGGVGWATPSNLARYNHIYQYNYLLDIAFPRYLIATGYTVRGGTSSLFLKANGTVDSTAYLPLTGGIMTGSISYKLNVTKGTSPNERTIFVCPWIDSANRALGSLEFNCETNGINKIGLYIINNNNASSTDFGGFYIFKLGSYATSYLSTFNASTGLMTAKTFNSTETLAAPFTVASSTKVTNLNADKLDGYDASTLASNLSVTSLNGMINVSINIGGQDFAAGTAVDYAQSCNEADIALTLNNWTLDNLLCTGYVTSPTANLSNYWAKAWEETITNKQGNNLDMTWYVASAFNNLEGIIHFNIRQNLTNDATYGYKFSVKATQLTGNIPLDRVRLYYNNDTGLCLIWMDVAGRWGVFNITVLKKSWRTAKDESNIGTLSALSFTTALTLPSGTLNGEVKGNNYVIMSLNTNIEAVSYIKLTYVAPAAGTNNWRPVLLGGFSNSDLETPPTNIEGDQGSVYTTFEFSYDLSTQTLATKYLSCLGLEIFSTDNVLNLSADFVDGFHANTLLQNFGIDPTHSNDIHINVGANHMYITMASLKTALGLGSNAYTSTAYLPISTINDLHTNSGVIINGDTIEVPRFSSGTFDGWNQFTIDIPTVSLDTSNPASSTTYYGLWTTSDSDDLIYMNDGFRYQTLLGSSSTVGYGTLILGNATNSGTAGNKRGRLRLYAGKSGFADLVYNLSTTAQVTHTLPAIGGTILNSGTTSVTRQCESGTPIAIIRINGSDTLLYAPTATGDPILDTNTWDPCTTSLPGYVPQAIVSSILHTDSSGNLIWGNPRLFTLSAGGNVNTTYNLGDLDFTTGSPLTIYAHDPLKVYIDGFINLELDSTRFITDGMAGFSTYRYGTSGTGASTATKVVSLVNGGALIKTNNNFNTGAIITVKFSNANSASTPQLQVNSLTKPIKFRGTQITSGPETQLIRGIVTFVYDGSYWNIVGEYIDTTYTTLSAVSGGASLSLVTTGEKYTWNNKQNAIAAVANSSTTRPVYTTTAGVFALCSTYAGGTLVSLNGSSKGGTSASFYAPTQAGTAGQILYSNGPNNTPYWAAPPVGEGSTPNNGPLRFYAGVNSKFKSSNSSSFTNSSSNTCVGVFSANSASDYGLTFRPGAANGSIEIVVASGTDAVEGYGGNTYIVQVPVKGLGDLAYLSKGSGSSKFLREDGTWLTVALGGAQTISYVNNFNGQGITIGNISVDGSNVGNITMPVSATVSDSISSSDTCSNYIGSITYGNNTKSFYYKVSNIQFKRYLESGNGLQNVVLYNGKAGNVYALIAGKNLDVSVDNTNITLSTRLMVIGSGSSSSSVDLNSITTNLGDNLFGPMDMLNNAYSANFPGDDNARCHVWSASRKTGSAYVVSQLAVPVGNGYLSYRSAYPSNSNTITNWTEWKRLLTFDLNALDGVYITPKMDVISNLRFDSLGSRLVGLPGTNVTISREKYDSANQRVSNYSYTVPYDPAHPNAITGEYIDNDIRHNIMTNGLTVADDNKINVVYQGALNKTITNNNQEVLLGVRVNDSVTISIDVGDISTNNSPFYGLLNSVFIAFVDGGHTCLITIKAQSYSGSTDIFVQNKPITGWPGHNMYYFPAKDFGGYTSHNTSPHNRNHYRKLIIEIKVIQVNASGQNTVGNIPCVRDIRVYGPNPYVMPSWLNNLIYNVYGKVIDSSTFGSNTPATTTTLKTISASPNSSTATYKILFKLSPSDNGTIDIVNYMDNFYVNSSGVYHSSDRCLKTNIVEYLAPKELNNPIRRFNWKDDLSNDNIGFIAQELEEWCPEAVGTGDNGIKTVNYTMALSALCGYLFQEIKKLKDKLEKLEQERTS